MVGFGNAGSSSSEGSKDPLSINTKTGFRSLSTIPDLLGIDDYDFNYVPRPDNEVVPVDYSVDPFLETDNNENPDNSQEVANQNKKDYLTDYNDSISTFGSEGMTDANISNPVANPTDFYGNPIQKEIIGPSFDPLKMLAVLATGVGMPALATGLNVASGIGGDAIPSEGYGTPGTYSSITGNRFDADGRGINPITGQYEDEYGTTKAGYNNMYDELGVPTRNLDGSMDYLGLGDRDKAEQGYLTDLEYAAQRSELAGLASGTTDKLTGNPTGTGLSTEAENAVVYQLGLDQGIQPHTMQPQWDEAQGKMVPSPTFETLRTGVYVEGSQIFPGGSTTKGPAEKTAADYYTPPVTSGTVEDGWIGNSLPDGTATPVVDTSNYDDGSSYSSGGDDGSVSGGGHDSFDSGGWESFNTGGLVTNRGPLGRR